MFAGRFTFAGLEKELDRLPTWGRTGFFSRRHASNRYAKHFQMKDACW